METWFVAIGVKVDCEYEVPISANVVFIVVVVVMAMLTVVDTVVVVATYGLVDTVVFIGVVRAVVNATSATVVVVSTLQRANIVLDNKIKGLYPFGNSRLDDVSSNSLLYVNLALYSDLDNPVEGAPPKNFQLGLRLMTSLEI